MGEKPAYTAYAVESEGENAQWTRIGAAWTTKGQGINVVLRALPLNGRIVLRVPKPEDEDHPIQQPRNNQRR